jgi:hypothetical protein
MPELEPMVVGPSRQHAAWQAFFAARSWDPTDFARLIESDEIGRGLFEVETMINGLYRAVEQAYTLKQTINIPINTDAIEQVKLKARWLDANSQRYRAALGPQLRELDLGVLRWIRRASCLSAVIGAGVTMDAGGPSWPELVRRLLVLVLERGRESYEMRPTPDSTPERMELQRVVTGVERLPPAEQQQAREILAKIAAGTADTKDLMEGAELHGTLMGALFPMDLSQILYANTAPGPIHHAIAQLAAPVVVPDRGAGEFPGWNSIITYNYDDLMGEALDAAGLARAAYAMRGAQLAGDPNRLAIERGQQGLHQAIYHLHGYSPRRLFLITHVQFVISASQYERVYGAGERAAIIDHVFQNWLARPVRHALYIGCSFQDEAMNGLLRQAAAALPGRYHYALLKWPGEKRFQESTAEEIGISSVRYIMMGVRPLWFDDFSEIPQLLQHVG